MLVTQSDHVTVRSGLAASTYVAVLDERRALDRKGKVTTLRIAIAARGEIYAAQPVLLVIFLSWVVWWK